MRIDEFVDSGSILRLDFLEVQPHAVAAIARGDAALGVPVARRAGRAVASATRMVFAPGALAVIVAGSPT